MSNTDLMREGYARYSRRDFGIVDELFAEDIVFDVPDPRAPFRGRAAVVGFFQGLAEMFDGHEIVMDDAIEQDDRLVCFCRHRLTDRQGRVHEVDSVMDWRFSGGRAASVKEVADTMGFAQAAGMIPAEG
jgi:ketosteroid isomerase-like protein